MRNLTLIVAALVLASCDLPPPSGPGAEVPQAHEQDSTRCVQDPEDPFCD